MVWLLLYMYQDPLLCFVLREIGRWVVSEFVEKDSKLLKKKKKNAKVNQVVGLLLLGSSRA